MNATGGGSTEILFSSAIVDDKGDDKFAHEQYGAPELFITRLTVAHKASTGDNRIAVTIWCVNKTSTRLPETMFVSFTPDNASASTSSWQMQKLGQWQATDDVVAGGSQHLHGVSIGSGVRFNKTVNGQGWTFGIEALDAPVMNLGEPLGFPVPCTKMEDPWAYKPDLETFGISKWVLPPPSRPALRGLANRWLPALSGVALG